MSPVRNPCDHACFLLSFSSKSLLRLDRVAITPLNVADFADAALLAQHSRSFQTTTLIISGSSTEKLANTLV